MPSDGPCHAAHGLTPAQVRDRVRAILEDPAGHFKTPESLAAWVDHHVRLAEAGAPAGLAFAVDCGPGGAWAAFRRLMPDDAKARLDAVLAGG